MKTKKYVNVEIVDQDNIGVIYLGEIDSSASTTEKAEQIMNVIKEKLGEVLQGHFDNDIEILGISVNSVGAPIQVNGVVRIIDCDDEEECSVEEVTFTEIWVY
jgi:hypothetical protein